LSGTAAGLRPRRPGLPYLVARQNGTPGDWNYTENSAGNFTVPDIPNLCGLGPPGDDSELKHPFCREVVDVLRNRCV